MFSSETKESPPMASAQEQVEQFFMKLNGGIESMLIDHERETTLAEYSLYGTPETEADRAASELFGREVSRAINSYLRAARQAGAAGEFEEMILTVDDVHTFVCPLESDPSVLLSGTLSAESSSLGMLRLQTREAAKTITV